MVVIVTVGEMVILDDYGSGSYRYRVSGDGDGGTDWVIMEVIEMVEAEVAEKKRMLVVNTMGQQVEVTNIAVVILDAVAGSAFGDGNCVVMAIVGMVA